jgi:hypothetical protein
MADSPAAAASMAERLRDIDPDGSIFGNSDDEELLPCERPPAPEPDAAAAAATPVAPRRGPKQKCPVARNSSNFKEADIAEQHGGVENIPYSFKRFTKKGVQYAGWSGTYAQIEAMPVGPRRTALRWKYMKLRENYHKHQSYERKNVAGGNANSQYEMQKRAERSANPSTVKRRRKRSGTGATTGKRAVSDVKAAIQRVPAAMAANVIDRALQDPDVREHISGAKTVITAKERRLLDTLVAGSRAWADIRRRKGISLLTGALVGQSKALANVLELGRQAIGVNAAIGQTAAQEMLRVNAALQHEATQLLRGVYNDSTKAISLGLIRTRRGRQVSTENVSAVVDFINADWLNEVPGRTKRVVVDGRKARVSVCALRDTTENIFHEFKKAHSDVVEGMKGRGVKRSLFHSIITDHMPWVVLLKHAPRRTCVCTMCEQMRCAY